jgi:LuxR family transcriptional regulator, maltose regulon positive regulatory protein
MPPASADALSSKPAQAAACFSRAKIQQPRLRMEQIPRPALEQRLERALHERALVLLSAPAGYGKTVLLSRVLGVARHGHAVAWISADEEDDLQRLVQSLATALEPHDLPWLTSPESLGALAADNPRRAADTLLDTLAGAEVKRGILVLEDGHRLQDGAVFEWLDRVLERLPPAWCLALTSRVDPPLGLARLRVREELEELRAEDLRFSLEEAHALAQESQAGSEAGPRLDATAIEALWQRTYGWPVGLYLALRTGHTAQAAWRADRHAFDYLASEVLAQMPEGLRRFLMVCAVLPELTASRCLQVSGDAQAPVWLDEIERRGLFVTALDSQERTLRLHDLFREFLEDQLRRFQGDALPGLLLRAAEGEADPVRRVGYLLRAGDFEAARYALAESTPALLLEGAGAQVMRLLEQFPREQRQASPLLDFVQGLYAWPYFDWEPMAIAMARAAAGFTAQGLSTQARQAEAFQAMALLNLGRLDETATLLERVRTRPETLGTAAFGELLAYWYTGAWGPAEAPAQHLSLMLGLLEQDLSPELWYRCVPHFLFLGRPGVNSLLGRYADQALGLAGDSHPHLRGSARALQAWLLLFQGRAEEAEAAIREAQDEERWLGQSNNLRVVVAGFLGTLHALRGNLEGCLAAQSALLEIDRHAASNGTWRGVYLYHFSRWHAACGDWDTVTRLAALITATPSDREWPFMAQARPGLEALLALRQGDYLRCEALLAPLMAQMDDRDMFAAGATLRLTLALAQARLGRLAEAWSSLAPALDPIRASGERFSLLMAGPVLLAEAAGLFRDQARRDNAAIAPGQLHLLEDLATQAAGLHTAVARELPANPLSEREQEVLAHLSAGASNKEIARTLDLSLHTVKRHIANILGKLHLRSRGEAAAWWHARG